MNATIVGGGLVGSLWSIFLARRGFSVTMHERRPDMRRADIPAGRSINLAVSTRGLHALERVGLREKVLEHGVAMRGRMIHAPDGSQSLLRYGKDDSECIFSISRGTLNKVLLSEAEETGRVRVHFDRLVRDVRFSESAVHFADEAGEHSAELLFATDGSASAVRAALMKLPGHRETSEELSYGYKELTIAPAHSAGLDRHALHIWPRGTFMLIALPNEDDSYTCTLFLPQRNEHRKGTRSVSAEKGPGSEAAGGRKCLSFEELGDDAAVRAFFGEHFADAVPRLPDLTEQFFTNPVGQMWTVKCAPWNYQGRALLLGDAAHAIVPFFGQGMNCGFEDCALLDDLIAKGTYDLPTLFSAFSTMRKPNADAIADMAVENFIEMRDKVADPKFVFEKEVEKILQKEFPGDYVPRYGLVTFSRVPYRIAFEAGVRQQAILTELCATIQKPQDVDLKRAKQLIVEKLTPLLRG